jgi:hypothetical protein
MYLVMISSTLAYLGGKAVSLIVRRWDHERRSLCFLFVQSSDFRPVTRPGVEIHFVVGQEEERLSTGIQKP